MIDLVVDTAAQGGARPEPRVLLTHRAPNFPDVPGRRPVTSGTRVCGAASTWPIWIPPASRRSWTRTTRTTARRWSRSGWRS